MLPDGIRGETARDFSASTSVKDFQVYFQCSQIKKNHSRAAYKRTGRIKALYSCERDSLEGPHDAEAMERSALK